MEHVMYLPSRAISFQFPIHISTTSVCFPSDLYLSGNIIVLPARLFSANNTCTSVFFIFVYVPLVKGTSRRVNDSV